MTQKIPCFTADMTERKARVELMLDIMARDIAVLRSHSHIQEPNQMRRALIIDEYRERAMMEILDRGEDLRDE
jgi:hypothetical protein